MSVEMRSNWVDLTKWNQFRANFLNLLINETPISNSDDNTITVTEMNLPGSKNRQTSLCKSLINSGFISKIDFRP
jgi:hypothetical protein